MPRPPRCQVQTGLAEFTNPTAMIEVDLAALHGAAR